MAGAARTTQENKAGKVLCLRCRGRRCRCERPPHRERVVLQLPPALFALCLTGAALAGSLLGAALALLR